MIQQFVDRFIENKEAVLANIRQAPPYSYRDVVEIALRHAVTDDYGQPDPSRIHELDDGDYQGTLVFVIAATGYQPYDYWYVKVSYGSCSGCDTLQAISDSMPYESRFEGKPAPESAVQDYYTLVLHIVQSLKPMQDE